MEVKKIKKAIIPAAGLGTRFLPATKAQPKEMLPIVDKPTIQYIVEEAVASGIEDILIIIGRNKHIIEDHFDRSIELELQLEKTEKDETLKLVKDIAEMANIQFIRQKSPLGLGHAVLCAKNFVGNEPFAVLLGDDIVDAETPCLKQLIDVYEKEGCSVIGVQQVEEHQVYKYGIVDGSAIAEHNVKVNSLVEKPVVQEAPSNIAILGRYIITPSIFSVLENTLPGAGGEIQLTDGLNVLASQEKLIAHIFSGKRYDVGDKLGFLKATVEFALKREDLAKEFKDYLKEIIK